MKPSTTSCFETNGTSYDEACNFCQTLGTGQLMLVEFGNKEPLRRMGGSALAQAYDQVGDEAGGLLRTSNQPTLNRRTRI